MIGINAGAESPSKKHLKIDTSSAIDVKCSIRYGFVRKEKPLM